MIVSSEFEIPTGAIAIVVKELQAAPIAVHNILGCDEPLIVRSTGHREKQARHIKAIPVLPDDMGYPCRVDVRPLHQNKTLP